MNDTKKGFLDLLGRFETAMLVTKQQDGTLRARPMAVAKAQDNGDLWFVTALGTGKVEEVLHDPGVVATFQSQDRYLSISGRAEVVGDETLIDELWREEWQQWFAGGRQDPSLAMIHVRATEAEYWDWHGGNGARYAFERARAALRGGGAARPEDAQHGRVVL